MSPTVSEVPETQGATTLRPTVYCPSSRVADCLPLKQVAEEVR